MQNEENNEEMQTCPFCAEKIKARHKNAFLRREHNSTLRTINNLMNKNKIHTELSHNKIQSQVDSKLFSDKKLKTSNQKGGVRVYIS